MPGIEDVQDQPNDLRTAAERSFFDLSVDGQLTLKRLLQIDASDGVPEAIDTDMQSDRICLYKNYKSNKKRGRKDPLKGKDVLSVPSEKGPILLDIEDAKDFGKLLYSYAEALEEAFEKKDQ